MTLNAVFDKYVDEYEAWFDRYPLVFLSELAAIKEAMPEKDGLYAVEVGVGTGHFAAALGIREGVDPSHEMRLRAQKRGIEVMEGWAESLPFKDHKYDVVLMVFAISYFSDLLKAFKEAYRVLKSDGILIVGFVDKDSRLGHLYESRKPDSHFYRSANFYATSRVEEDLKKAGFRQFAHSQTLFRLPDAIDKVEVPEAGTGRGSFIVIKASKQWQNQA